MATDSQVIVTGLDIYFCFCVSWQKKFVVPIIAFHFHFACEAVLLYSVKGWMSSEARVNCVSRLQIGNSNGHPTYFDN
jgi:hypothetical protein